MELMCPRCGETVPVVSGGPFPCPHCGGFVQREPYGRAFVLSPAQGPDSPQRQKARALLQRARMARDPAKKHALLVSAEELDMAEPEVQAELLHLGKLWQRRPGQVDYALIKSYLLHLFEAPQEYSPAARAEVLQELTADPRLLRCLALEPLPEEMRRRYCLRLCREYIRTFLMGSPRHRRMVMGIATQRAEKALAGVSAQMLREMARSALPAPYDALLPETFCEAFRLEVGDDAWLKQAMKELER